jgi:antitoxin (DNA-binding transcriptional repressor) of toxin-antitoxin stability system
MRPIVIAATDAARNFSDLLNRVRYQAASFDVTRGREVVARIVPPTGTTEGMALADLAGLLRRLTPLLSPDERKRFAADVTAARKKLKTPASKWD